jgi:hypothetical protein
MGRHIFVAEKADKIPVSKSSDQRPVVGKGRIGNRQSAIDNSPSFPVAFSGACGRLKPDHNQSFDGMNKSTPRNMSLPRLRRDRRRVLPLLLLALSLSVISGKPDSLELVNGDVYSGTLISVSASNLVFQSEIQGRVTLPREKVAQITIREPVAAKSGAPPNAPAPRPVAASQFSLQFTNRAARATNAPASRGEAVVRQLRRDGANSKTVTQVREQILSRAAPEAGDKFDELLGGLVSGKLSLDDLRAQAGSSIKNIQAARGEMGEETALMLDGYLTILQNFLNETEPVPAAKTAATNNSSPPR